MVVGVAFVLMGAPVWVPFIDEALGVTLLLAFAANAYPVRRRGLVRADRRGLSFDGTMLVARDRVAAAYALSLADPIVRVALHKTFPFDVRLASDEDAAALLDALGMGIGESTASFRALAGRRTWLAGVIMAIVVGQAFAALAIVLLHRAGPWPSVCVGVGIMAACLLVYQGRAVVTVDVGSDGLLLRRLGDQRFIPFEELEGVNVERGAVTLLLRSGRPIQLGIGTSQQQSEAGAALVRRIEESRGAYASKTDRNSTGDLLAPGGRPLRRWLSEVRALARARDYREARVDGDRLWRVLDDATTSPATRAGAAIALSADESSRRRLRVAADACAEPRLRVALTRVAEGAADAELEEALAPLLEAEE
jgi:hypothetical protein